MFAAGTKLKDFYQSELSALRTEAVAFADQHPEVAKVLGLNRQQATDPQVELLLQSFAFLAGRLQHQVAVDEATLPNALLAFLYPHLEAPLPSMLVAQLSVKPDGANFAKEQMLPRGRYISAAAANQLGQKIECRFRTCFDTPLLPLLVHDVSVESAANHAFLKGDVKAQSVIRVQIRTDGAGKLQATGLERMRFYIDNTVVDAYQLYEALALHLIGVAVVLPAADQAKSGISPALNPVDDDTPEVFRWLGAADDEAMLVANPLTHAGYRLLQEYFAFPEKFMFFEAGRLNIGGAQDRFDLLFVLDATLDKGLQFQAGVLRLNCVPLVNLFSQRIEPLALDHTQYEYHLLGDLENHRYCEIYAIESLESIRPNGSPRPIAPYFAMDDGRRLDQQDYFYVLRRERSPTTAGTELFVSFLDQQFDLTQLVDEVIGGRALCTNRRLPEQLVAGAEMYLEGAGPVTRIVALRQPTPHRTPTMIGARPWALVSQLALNHLSLADGPQALTALKDILRLHVGADSDSGQKQIDGLIKLHCRPMMRNVTREGWRGFVRGLEIRLEMDRFPFEDASPVLFCAVLRHFFSLFATVNNLVETSLETHDIKGIQKQWQALAGAQTVL